MSRQVHRDWFLSRVRPGRCQATNRRATASSFPFLRRLRIEPLEDRRLLSITVDTLIDENDGIGVGGISLRDAIVAAASGDTIDFAAALTSGGPATILLTQGELKITDALSINGPGANLLTIDASGNDPTPNLNNGDGSRVFNIDDGNDANLLDVSVSGLTLTGGDVNGGGGAILTRENLSVTSSTISGNQAGNGGGIWANGDVTVTVTVTVTSSTISGNAASGTSGGAGYGGGIVANGDVTVTASTISGNSAGNGVGFYSRGGGIFAGGNVTVTSSTISGNSASGTSAGYGGGIFAGGNVTVTSSTISGNSSRSFGFGGGIFAGGNVTVTSSTISGNQAGNGGGIWAAGDVTVTSSTISGNSASYGGGIWAANGPVTITNSIVAGNTSNAFSDLMPGSGVLSVHYSLIGDNTDTGLDEAPVGSPDANGNLIGGPVGGVINPQLAPLANNGGPTQTHALLPGSPATGAGDPAAVAGMGGVPLYDQRGAPWSRVVGGRLDIGAVESQPNPLPGDYNFNGIVDAADYCVWRDTLGSTTDLRADGDGNGLVDQPDYDRWRAAFGNTRLPPSGVGSMLSTGAANGEAAAARSVAADNASPITASAQAVDRALAELGGGVPVRGSERFALAVPADRRMAARQADANLLLLAVARSAPPDADADYRLGAPAHDQELDAARQFERWGEVGIEWDVGPNSLYRQLVNA